MSHQGDSAAPTVSAQPVSLREAALLYTKGVAMGLGDSVPGVSGGTIAVITHIYDTLIYSIRSIDLVAVRLLLALQWQNLWRHVNGNFLLVLLLGVVSGLLLSAQTVLFLLDNYFEALMAFFIGLVLASIWLLRGNLDWGRVSNLVAMLFGIVLVAGVGLIEPGLRTPSLPYVFFSGMLAISAMILPGLSGAFILLVLGVYQFILQALLNLDIVTITVFVAGCAIGIVAFSRVLAWLLLRHHELCYAGICGLLLGSLIVLWPWQQAISWYTDSEGVQQPLQTVNVMPMSYFELTGNSPMLGVACLACLAGLASVLLLSRIAAD